MGFSSEYWHSFHYSDVEAIWIFIAMVSGKHYSIMKTYISQKGIQQLDYGSYLASFPVVLAKWIMCLTLLGRTTISFFFISWENILTWFVQVISILIFTSGVLSYEILLLILFGVELHNWYARRVQGAVCFLILKRVILKLAVSSGVHNHIAIPFLSMLDSMIYGLNTALRSRTVLRSFQSGISIVKKV